LESFFDKVFAVVKQIPWGKVATYGQIALAVGCPGASRAVGSTLRKNPDPGMFPCHRVVNSKGELAAGFAFGGTDMQKKLLEDEGVVVSESGTVNLEKYVHKF
jgi:methylated-DNA-protein-cysteine methyltransferase-like protein